MISVTVGTTTNKTTDMFSPETTIRQILEAKSVDYSAASILIDGANITAGDLDKSLAALNKTTRCFIIAAVKAEAATN